MASPTRAEIVDEYGEVCRRSNLWKPPANATDPDLPRKKELEQIISGWPGESKTADAKELVVRGAIYQVKLSPCGFKQVVSLEAWSEAFEDMKEKLGKLVFKFFTTPLDALREHKGKAWYDSHVKKEQTGPRKIVVAAKEAAGYEAA